ncbi:MAG: adenine deaminase, partial [Leptospiraceae bacterium]|nr:adenine deaminase [Leptospiraceae bacterium]
MSRIDHLKDRANVAAGNKPADLVIRNVNVLNVATGTQDVTDIAIHDGYIVGLYEGAYEGVDVIDGTGLNAVPGFIDSHLHIESSLLTPQEFDRIALPRGTTTVVADPHEAANVMGTEAFDYWLESASASLMDIRVQLSSSVPATSLETSGATLAARDLRPYKTREGAGNLAEFMDIGGVASGNKGTFAKLAAFEGELIEGHLTAIRGRLLNMMAAVRINNDHEST